ncbi:MAG: Wzz/FepE/Etk N-terminal domain-containing protein [Proteobacteria bacterium]|nr:Wzz/FepE/Etk N-terminal domain-containing protein [Pseudomonadota bacterium]
MTESQQNPPQSYDDEIDLRQLFRVLWDGKWLIGGITFAVAVLAVIVALMLPNIYRAEALLAPNDQEGAGGLSALAAQYGGLASLAGINLSAGSADKTALGIEVLKSRKFISEFIERHDILVPLMAAKDWDSESGELEIDSDVYDVVEKQWVREVSPPKKTIPSMQEAYEEFMDILSVSQDKKSGFVRIAIEHYSPTTAKQWVDWLVQDINSTIVQQDVREAEQAIEYLNLQIENTSLTELKNVFFRLIEEQTKTVMLAKVSDEYLLKTLDPAIAPELKAKPKRSLIVILATMLGGILGIVIQLIRSSNKGTAATSHCSQKTDEGDSRQKPR